MLVYKCYVLFDSYGEAMSCCKEKPWFKTGVPFYVGFYKEKGRYAVDVGWPGVIEKKFAKSGAEDRFILETVETSIWCKAGYTDLLIWEDTELDQMMYCLADYLGFAKPVGANLYKIPG